MRGACKRAHLTSTFALCAPVVRRPRQIVSGGSTFGLWLLSKKDGSRILILDILAVAVSNDHKGKGVGTLLLASLKAISKKAAPRMPKLFSHASTAWNASTN